MGCAASGSISTLPHLARRAGAMQHSQCATPKVLLMPAYHVVLQAAHYRQINMERHLFFYRVLWQAMGHAPQERSAGYTEDLSSKTTLQHDGILYRCQKHSRKYTKNSDLALAWQMHVCFVCQVRTGGIAGWRSEPAQARSISPSSHATAGVCCGRHTPLRTLRCSGMHA